MSTGGKYPDTNGWAFLRQMSYVVTGAAGFIGSNLVRALNERGVTDILAVDDLRDGDKFVNLADCEIADYVDKERLLELVREGALDGDVDVVMHQGACSDTTERDGRYVMNNNYGYSNALLEFCIEEAIPLIYASIGGGYGARHVVPSRNPDRRRRSMYMAIPSFSSTSACGGASRGRSQVDGTPLFQRVWQERSAQGRMSSVAWHFFNQYRATGKVRLFEGSTATATASSGAISLSVEDVVSVNLCFLDRPGLSGIFNVGTGAAQSFNDVAMAVMNACRSTTVKRP